MERSCARSLLAAARTSFLLSALFLTVYPLSNWLTSLRGQVATWRYGFEDYIPFVPAMILPYMSIDLFFIAAPFLCSSERERRVFARRVVFGILAAGACFLALPLRLAVERPHTVGWLGAVFDGFRAMDKPHNLFPSLHITLRTLLASLYARHTRGVLRLASNAWFFLIGLSTLLTYQHHLVDVAGGFLLAALCFHLFPEEASPRLPVERDARLGFRYALGPAAAAVLAAAFWPRAGLLLWPALSLGLVASAYFGVGPGIFRKAAGRLPWSARLVLAPYLAGQWLSLFHYRRQCRPWDEVAPGLLLGRRLSDREAGEAVRRGVSAVLDLTGEFSEARPFLDVTYKNIPVLDLTAPTPRQLQEGVAFIEEHLARGKVYVHCKIGYSRSAAVAGAWLLSSGRASSPDQAVAMLRAARPPIVLRPEALVALRGFPAGQDGSVGAMAGPSLSTGGEAGALESGK